MGVTWNGYKVIYDATAVAEHEAHGYTDHQAGVIKLDPNERGKAALDTTLHEALHALYPDMSEAAIGMGGRALAELLWRLKYRRGD